MTVSVEKKNLTNLYKITMILDNYDQMQHL